MTITLNLPKNDGEEKTDTYAISMLNNYSFFKNLPEWYRLLMILYYNKNHSLSIGEIIKKQQISKITAFKIRDKLLEDKYIETELKESKTGAVRAYKITKKGIKFVRDQILLPLRELAEFFTKNQSSIERKSGDKDGVEK